MNSGRLLARALASLRLTVKPEALMSMARIAVIFVIITKQPTEKILIYQAVTAARPLVSGLSYFRKFPA